MPEQMIEYPVTINGIKVLAQYSRRSVDEIFLPLLQTLSTLQREKGRRILVMLAAPPGSGKSTLLSFLESLSHSAIQVIGMDGFHRRQAYLVSHFTERNGKQIPMVDIKGAPVTFDLDLLTAGVKKVASGETCGWPVYDRMRHDPVEDAIWVDGDIVLLEGNYLLLDQDGWRELSGYADYTVSIRADEADSQAHEDGRGRGRCDALCRLQRYAQCQAVPGKDHVGGQSAVDRRARRLSYLPLNK